MSNLRKYSSYSISAASFAAVIGIAVDRYAEFAVGAESLASWTMPPFFLLAIAVTALATVKLGHPVEGETHA